MNNQGLTDAQQRKMYEGCLLGGAVCGNILGAWLGVEAIENAFDLDDLELADVIRTIADDLFTSANQSQIPEQGADPLWDERYYSR